MRAVNLMPRDARGASGSGPSGSGAGVYVLIAGLAGLVLLATLWAFAGKQAGDREAKLTRVNAQAAAAEQRATEGAPYVAFAKLASDRVGTVTTLSTTRFDWAHAMREVGRVLPDDVWLTAMSGASGAGSAPPTPATSAAPAPTITLLGCTRSQARVARLMARLRTIDGVRKIGLKTSEKPDTKGDKTCPANRPSDPRFTIAVSFAVPGAPKDRVDATGQVLPSQAAATPAPAGSGSGPSAATASNITPAAADSKDG
jgi:Tfp pilus assembly protein PilN